ncbi:uncharacterized protein LOC116412842 [Galleria mellonella]|uniref:Uncharacterized protein LOC116412842 n=1 Tax=Galleria mellonella TaxID=7137 RepID=A0ABM3MN12_GALME|nr:uncharacterized protein LOC116412842 [Galleria mellonella]
MEQKKDKKYCASRANTAQVKYTDKSEHSGGVSTWSEWTEHSKEQNYVLRRQRNVTSLQENATTEADNLEVTDLSESEIVDAMNFDVEVYSTISFHYLNSQNVNPENVKFQPINQTMERCYDDYIRCILTQPVREQVCAANEPNKGYGYNTLDSICDAYFDNCRRGIRFWRIVKDGACDYKSKNTHTVYSFGRR